jgi:hypothetical protein
VHTELLEYGELNMEEFEYLMEEVDGETRAREGLEEWRRLKATI